MLRPDIAETTITDVGTRQIRTDLVLKHGGAWSPWGGILTQVGINRETITAGHTIQIDVYDATGRWLDSQTLVLALNEQVKFGTILQANYAGPLTVHARWTAGGSPANVVLNVQEYSGIVEQLLKVGMAVAEKMGVRFIFGKRWDNEC